MSPADFRQHRDRLGLTQAALAAELGISASHVAHVEQGATPASPALCAHVRLLVRVAGAGLAPTTSEV